MNDGKSNKIDGVNCQWARRIVVNFGCWWGWSQKTSQLRWQDLQFLRNTRTLPGNRARSTPETCSVDNLPTAASTKICRRAGCNKIFPNGFLLRLNQRVNDRFEVIESADRREIVPKDPTTIPSLIIFYFGRIFFPLPSAGNEFKLPEVQGIIIVIFPLSIKNPLGLPTGNP